MTDEVVAMIHQNIDERLLRPLPEATYLTTENAWRYRAILRYFYIQHERLRHFLMPEEVFDYLKDSPYFAKIGRASCRERV